MTRIFNHDRKELDHSLQGVEGWLFPDEAWELNRRARGINPDSSEVLAVEIGTWKGRSTIAIALGMRARGNGRVTAIDPHSGDPSRTGSGPPVTVQEFRENVERAGVSSIVDLIMSTSHEARPRIADYSVDFLFVDGSHVYNDVKTDILDWQTALRDRAVVAFNDPSSLGVYRALSELVIRPGPYRRPKLIDNTLFFEFDRAGQWTNREAWNAFRLRLVLAFRLRISRARPYAPAPIARAARRIINALAGG